LHNHWKVRSILHLGLFKSRKVIMFTLRFFLCLFSTLVFCCLSLPAMAAGRCQEFDYQDIPQGYFHALSDPMNPLRVTQIYNTTYSQGWCSVNKVIYDVGHPNCQGRKIYHGHDGLDLSPVGNNEGVAPIYAIQPGLVVYTNYLAVGWGESMIVATRPHTFSNEIITHHYHHMYGGSQQFSECESVGAGDQLGLEGGTPDWASHLHLGIKRWKNLQKLKEALISGSILGSGYVGNDSSRLAHHLDPEGILFGFFRDTQGEGNFPYSWATNYALEMRMRGFEFGLYDGNYGLGQTVTRRELARWLKLATYRPHHQPATPTFTDVPASDPDWPYIEALTLFPSYQTVINPQATCHPGQKHFCPDDQINRAAVLKMVVLAFYQEEFFDLYNRWIWSASENVASTLLSQFSDIDIWSWYAPYAYFGLINGLVAPNQFFRPNDPIVRAEAAKWVIEGFKHYYGDSPTPCGVTCAQGYFCDSQSNSCQEIPSCLPSETNPCPLGGGCQGPNCQDSTPPYQDCLPGYIQQQNCGNGGMQNRVCNADGSWGNWGNCTGEEPPPPPPPDCVAGQTQQQSCAGGTGTQSRLCHPNGTWGEWSSCVPTQPPPECQPIGASQTQSCDSGSGPTSGSQIRYCQSDNTWGNWEICQPNQSCVCSSGECCDGCWYEPTSEICSTELEFRCQNNQIQSRDVYQHCSGSHSFCGGQTTTGNWQIDQTCAADQICFYDGTLPECQDVCQEIFLISPSSGESCYGNPQGSGTPTLCLEMNQISGEDWEFRVCKQSGTFQSDFSYELLDDNHSAVYLGAYNGSAGSACTPWQDVSLSHITQNGSVNGAGLKVELLSPSNCSQQACTYYTGYLTVYKDCL
jgi:hypothetical protein